MRQLRYGLDLLPTIVITLLGASEHCYATSYTLRLSNPAFGLEIFGRVDTYADTFVITSWTDDSIFWVPDDSEFPITLEAFELTGNHFDIPDSWAGTMSGWAFVLPVGQSITTIRWEQGFPGASWANPSFGWGGERLQNGRMGLATRGTFALNYVPHSSYGSVGSRVVFPGISEVPEPSSMLLLGAGLLLLGRLGRRLTAKCSGPP